MNELALFAGAGGGILGGLLIGWRTVCAVEIEPYPRRILVQRQDDGHLSPFPIWDDVRTFDGRPWRGIVDVVSGGFPCQDISAAGSRRGLAGARSGLWAEFARIIGEVQPEWAFIENSQHLRTRGLVTVLQDLASLRYDARWCVLGASDLGAPHQRKRMWIAAHAHGRRERNVAINEKVAGPPGVAGHSDAPGPAHSDGPRPPIPRAHQWWPMSVAEGVDDGVAHRMERVRATGSGQVPSVAALAWRLLTAAPESSPNDAAAPCRSPARQGHTSSGPPTCDPQESTPGASAASMR